MGLIAETAVRTLVIGVLLPYANHDLGFRQVPEILHIQTFVAQATVEAFAKAVLPGDTWRTIHRLPLMRLELLLLPARST